MNEDLGELEKRILAEKGIDALLQFFHENPQLYPDPPPSRKNRKPKQEEYVPFWQKLGKSEKIVLSILIRRKRISREALFRSWLLAMAPAKNRREMSRKEECFKKVLQRLQQRKLLRKVYPPIDRSNAIKVYYEPNVPVAITLSRIMTVRVEEVLGNLLHETFILNKLPLEVTFQQLVAQLRMRGVPSAALTRQRLGLLLKKHKIKKIKHAKSGDVYLVSRESVGLPGLLS
jgi:hypothetical protein